MQKSQLLMSLLFLKIEPAESASTCVVAATLAHLLSHASQFKKLSVNFVKKSYKIGGFLNFERNQTLKLIT